MDMQTIITIIILAIAIAFSIRRLWLTFRNDNNSHTDGCSCGCDGCSLKNKCC